MVLEMYIATCERKSFKRRSMKPWNPLTRVYIDFSLKVVFWTHVAEGDVNVTLCKMQARVNKNEVSETQAGHTEFPTFQTPVVLLASVCTALFLTTWLWHKANLTASP